MKPSMTMASDGDDDGDCELNLGTEIENKTRGGCAGSKLGMNFQ